MEVALLSGTTNPNRKNVISNARPKRLPLKKQLETSFRASLRSADWRHHIAAEYAASPWATSDDFSMDKINLGATIVKNSRLAGMRSVKKR